MTNHNDQPSLEDDNEPAFSRRAMDAEDEDEGELDWRLVYEERSHFYEMPSGVVVSVVSREHYSISPCPSGEDYLERSRRSNVTYHARVQVQQVDAHGRVVGGSVVVIDLETNTLCSAFNKVCNEKWMNEKAQEAMRAQEVKQRQQVIANAVRNAPRIHGNGGFHG